MSNVQTVSAAALICAALGSSPASAQVLTGPTQFINLCTAAAKSSQPHPEAIHICTVAINDDEQVGRNLAGLYVNRGVLEMRQADFPTAGKDFNVALSIDPGLGEAWVNRGAVLIAGRQWSAGVADIDRGLALKADEPEKAYFNRAIARERLEDIKGAYLDYAKAAELAPDWSAPKDELKRFTVSPKPAS